MISDGESAPTNICFSSTTGATATCRVTRPHEKHVFPQSFSQNTLLETPVLWRICVGDKSRKAERLFLDTSHWGDNLGSNAVGDLLNAGVSVGTPASRTASSASARSSSVLRVTKTGREMDESKVEGSESNISVAPTYRAAKQMSKKALFFSLPRRALSRCSVSSSASLPPQKRSFLFVKRRFARVAVELPVSVRDPDAPELRDAGRRLRALAPEPPCARERHFSVHAAAPPPLLAWDAASRERL